MSKITYRNQPAIDKNRGAIPLAGTDTIYTIAARLWNDQVEGVLRGLLLGRSLHVCCGKPRLGDVLLDLDLNNQPNVIANASKLPFVDSAFDSVLCDPPYNGRFQWNHDLLSELARVARQRIVFQHWFIPADRLGRYKKRHAFRLHHLYCWQPKTYFGRVQMVSVFDHVSTTQA